MSWAVIACLGLAVSFAVASGSVNETAVRSGEELQSYRVPYRLSETLHLLLRAKLDGEGPFTFIVDTGAPMLVVSSEVARRVGVQAGSDGWATFGLMELEGGPRLHGIRAHVEDLFQLRGMNGLGLAGTKLHGVLGYTVLARYRMQFDLSRSAMVWTELDDVPAEPGPLLGVAGSRRTAPPELDAVGSLMQFAGTLLGRQAERRLAPRGLVGIELEEKEGHVAIRAVLPGSPADQAGMKAGDKVIAMAGQRVETADDVRKLGSETLPGQQLTFTVDRSRRRVKLTVTAGTGF